MRPATVVVIAVSLVDLVLLVALMLGAGRPDARVLCRDPWRGNLSADMPLTSVTQTPSGWVLYFPRRAPERQVEMWDACEVHQ